MIQKQTWKDEIRILITDEENLGSVQISIPLYVSDIFGKADALIYALFVDNNHRRKGVAQHLLQLAEQQAKLNGLGYNGYEKTSIFMFISFKELKDMAIERLTMSLEQHQKMYEEL